MTKLNDNQEMIRVLGLKEAISMTIGTVVGVGLFTCGSSQVGVVGPWIIVFTTVALLISIWPCLLYAEMSAMLPAAGGAYQYAKFGLNRRWAIFSGWQYIVSVIAIGAGETLAFANYFKILLSELGVSADAIDSRWIALVLVGIFLWLNVKGIEFSGKAQTAFVFFFWGCSIMWFLVMIPKVHIEYFGGFAISSLPPFEELMYIFGLVWWCYTGFETCVSMGGETKYPHIILPRALKLSVFLVFAVNALFQWFLVGLIPHHWYSLLAVSEAPYAQGLQVAGFVGFPVILLCIGIAFGGDLSTINPGIAAPARYMYAMAQDGALPEWFGRLHQRYKTPHYAIFIVGIINVILIATNSIAYIASVSLISLGLCYIVSCFSYMGLSKRYADLPRPYKAPYGQFGAWLTAITYGFMLVFSDKIALLTAIMIGIVSLFYSIVNQRSVEPIKLLLNNMEEPTDLERLKLNREYRIWKFATIVVCIVAIALYLVPIFS